MKLLEELQVMYTEKKRLTLKIKSASAGLMVRLLT